MLKLRLRSMASIDRQGNEQAEVRSADEQNFTVPMIPEIHDPVTRAVWGVVNENGTGARARVRDLPAEAPAVAAGSQASDH